MKYLLIVSLMSFGFVGSAFAAKQLTCRSGSVHSSGGNQFSCKIMITVEKKHNDKKRECKRSWGIKGTAVMKGGTAMCKYNKLGKGNKYLTNKFESCGKNHTASGIKCIGKSYKTTSPTYDDSKLYLK